MRLVLSFILLIGIVPALKAQDSVPLDVKSIATGLNDARSVYASSAGNLFIAETGNNRILKLSADGTRLDSLGRLGSGDYQFDRPLDVDATNELKIYVTDYNNRRIQVYDRRFQYLSTVELPQRLLRDRTYSPTKLTVNPIGQLFFYDEDSRHVYKYDANGRYEQRFDIGGEDRIFPPTAMTSSGDELFIADSRQNIIHRLNANGSYLGFIELPSQPQGVSIYDNHIYVLAGTDILIYSKRGQLSAIYNLIGVRGLRGLTVFRDQVFLVSAEEVYMARLNQ